jgi:hypothetical protein
MYTRVVEFLKVKNVSSLVFYNVSRDEIANWCESNTFVNPRTARNRLATASGSGNSAPGVKADTEAHGLDNDMPYQYKEKGCIIIYMFHKRDVSRHGNLLTLKVWIRKC